MGKKTRVALLTITVVLTLFTFVSMYMTRPGHSDWAKKVLEEAAARQNQSLVSVKEPLETDTKVLSEEEKMAEKVAAILSDDSSFNDKVKANIVNDITDELEAWKNSVKDDISKDVEEYLSSYSLDEYIPALKAEINSAIDERISELDASINSRISALDSKITSAEANASSYADSADAKVRSEMEQSDESLKALIESSVDIDAISRNAMANLGISEDAEYRGAVERLVEEVIKELLSNKEVEDAAKALIKSEQSVAQKSEEAAPVAETVATESAPSAKKPISIPTFSSQSQNLTQDEYKAERSKQRQNASISIDKWLTELE